MNTPSITRRTFVGTVAGLAAASPLAIFAESKPKSQIAGETLVAEFYKSLTEPQRKAICFPFDDQLRSKVDNNWLIVEQTISKLLTADQQDLARQIFRSLHSEQYADTVLRQVEHDNASDGGFGGCAVAVFGEPGTGKFEWVFTGRHVTRRCDGDSVSGAAFGGPIFYGHAARGFNESPLHEDNAYWYQARCANELFQALDGKQRKLALRDDPRPERATETVKLTGEIPGVPCSELTSDQKELVRKTLADLLSPFRKADADETLALIESVGGIEKLHMAYYKNMDIGDDGVWDVWQVQGPNTLWYFRGSPHVHAWVNVGGA